MKTQIAVQLGVWVLGMVVDYSLTGNVLMGGLIGATVGLLFVVYRIAPLTNKLEVK